MANRFINPKSEFGRPSRFMSAPYDWDKYGRRTKSDNVKIVAGVLTAGIFLWLLFK